MTSYTAFTNWKLYEKVLKIAEERCWGCQTGHASQKQHIEGCLESTVEKFGRYYDEAKIWQVQHEKEIIDAWVARELELYGGENKQYEDEVKLELDTATEASDMTSNTESQALIRSATDAESLIDNSCLPSTSHDSEVCGEIIQQPTDFLERLSRHAKVMVETAVTLCDDVDVYRALLIQFRPYNMGRLKMIWLITHNVCKEYPENREKIMKIYREETGKKERRRFCCIL